MIQKPTKKPITSTDKSNTMTILQALFAAIRVTHT